MSKRKRRVTVKERCRKVFREWSFYLMVLALGLGSAPDIIPHFDALLRHFVSDEARGIIQELLLILSIASRFVPQSVRHTVEELRDDEKDT